MVDPETIYNWRRLDDRITTSGQPTEPQLADIHALGVRHIVNLGLHSHEKALPDETASVSRLGMTYIHIPVDFQNPRTTGSRRFSTCIAGTCWEWTRRRPAPIWKTYGTRRASGRRSSAVRRGRRFRAESDPVRTSPIVILGRDPRILGTRRAPSARPACPSHNDPLDPSPAKGWEINPPYCLPRRRRWAPAQGTRAGRPVFCRGAARNGAAAG
jgi:hypothetical protein